MAEITEAKTIEEVFQELDNLAVKLENSETSLEDSFRFYKEGMELLKYCSDKLDTVEKKMLQMDEDGTLREFLRRITDKNRIRRESNTQMASEGIRLCQDNGRGDELQHVRRRETFKTDSSSGNLPDVWRGRTACRTFYGRDRDDPYAFLDP